MTSFYFPFVAVNTAMTKPILCSILLLTLCGCASIDQSTNAVDGFGATLSGTRDKETKLINSAKDNDEALRFLSKDSKFCIDAASTFSAPAQKILKAENDRISKKVKTAMAFMDNYNTALGQIVEGNDKFKDTLGKITPGVASLPIVSAYSSLIKAGGEGAVLGSDTVSAQLIQHVANEMNSKLNDAVKTLKGNITELTGGELAAFEKWDECERVSLIYMRDRSPDNVVSSTSVQLRNSYLSYLAQREINIQNPNVVAALDDILAQNKNIIDGKQPDPQNLLKSFTTMHNVYGASTSLK